MHMLHKYKLSAWVKLLLVIVELYALSSNVSANTNYIDGTITSAGLTGRLAEDLNWQILEQNLTRDESPAGMRFNETQLSTQVTKQLNPNIAVGLGYLHDWNTPLNKRPYDENRPYEDFVVSTGLLGFNINLRTRLDERIRYDTASTGMRLRELIQINRPLNFISPKLSAVLGNEVYGYLNNSAYGPKGVSEYRIQAGFSYQLNTHWVTDIAYLADYLYSTTNRDTLIDNLFANVRYQF